MARRRNESLVEVLMHLPWWIGIAAGIIGFAAVRWGAGLVFNAAGGPFAESVGAQLGGGALAPLAWMLLVACWIGAAASAIRAKHRVKLLDQQSSLDSLRSMSWMQFEQLVGEAYRRLGYQIAETGQGGADGGIDLLLRKGGRTTLVQCKQWRNQKVGIAIVREMFGLMTHHRADAVKIVCTGSFSSECEAFCRDKPIELVDGPALVSLVQAVQSSVAAPSQAPPLSRNSAAALSEPSPAIDDQTVSCPRCGSAMAKRANRTTGLSFWGCAQYPKCKGTRAA